DDRAEGAVALEAQGDELTLQVFRQKARQQQRAGERAAEGVSGDGSEIEQAPRRLHGLRGLRGDDAEVPAFRHPLDQSIVQPIGFVHWSSAKRTGSPLASMKSS